jgi:hypothetical protein
MTDSPFKKIKNSPGTQVTSGVGIGYMLVPPGGNAPPTDAYQASVILFN